jgi:hypothetical protein
MTNAPTIVTTTSSIDVASKVLRAPTLAAIEPAIRYPNGRNVAEPTLEIANTLPMFSLGVRFCRIVS